MTEKKKFALSGERLVIVVLVVALTFTLAGFAIAAAAPTAMPAANGIVRFCRANSNGNARIVTPSEACATSERKVQMRSYDPIALEYDGEFEFVITKNVGSHLVGVTHAGEGQYVVAFNKDVSRCVPTVSVTGHSNHIVVTTPGAEDDEIRIYSYNLANTADDTNWDLEVTC